MSDSNNNTSSAEPESSEYGESSQNTLNTENGVKFDKRKTLLTKDMSLYSKGKRIVDS